MPSNGFRPAETSASSGLEHLLLQQPIGDMGVPAGYAAPGFAGSNSQQDRAAMSKLAEKVLKDPLLLQQLSEQVYKLMQMDLEQQRERSGNYRRLL